MADDIAQWLEGLGLGQFAQAFAENGIDFDVRPRLTEDILKELGLNLGDRVRLRTAIEALAGDETSIRQGAPEPQPAEAERRQLTVMFCEETGTRWPRRGSRGDLRRSWLPMWSATAG